MQIPEQEFRRRAALEINCDQCGEMAGRPCIGGQTHTCREEFAATVDIEALADPRAVAIRLIAEVRNALVPARYHATQGGPVAAALQRVLDYTTACQWWLDANRARRDGVLP